MEQNFYERFGVPRHASLDEIKRAYRSLAMKYHPDRHDGNLEYEKIFKEINLIYEILSDENKREEYNIAAGLTEETAHTGETYDVEAEFLRRYAPSDPFKPLWENNFREQEHKTYIPPSFRARVMLWALRILFFILMMWFLIYIHTPKD